MARTRAQLAAQKDRSLSPAKDQGKRPGRNQEQKPSHPTGTPRFDQELTPGQTEHDQPNTSPVDNSLSTPNRGVKRRIEASDPELESDQKRPCPSPSFSHLNHTLKTPELDQGGSGNSEAIGGVGFWAREGRWPKEYFTLNMDRYRILAQKKSSSSLSRKRSNSGTSTTPSDQKPREEKSAPYRDPRYMTLLESKASFMDESDLGIAKQCEEELSSFLTSYQTVPNDTLFRDDLFKQTCRSINNKNEARVMRDLTPLIVPAAEILSIRGAKHLSILIESINEGWNNSIPLTGSRPQPDYSLGFRREAFSDAQLAKLSPFIGDYTGGDLSFFMATFRMYFPFLTCEVKSSAAALDVADCQNAHSMTLAVRGVTELFRAIKCEGQIHQQILGYSISHDHKSVRIYGHYPIIQGKDTKYYRHTIHTFDFTALNGKEKWTSYRFIKNVYDHWVPLHFKRICLAIDQLPSDLDFDKVSLPTTGLSQDLQGHDLSRSDCDSLPVEQHSEPVSGKHEMGTPSTSLTNPGTAKKRKDKK